MPILRVGGGARKDLNAGQLVFVEDDALSVCTNACISHTPPCWRGPAWFSTSRTWYSSWRWSPWMHTLPPRAHSLELLTWLHVQPSKIYQNYCFNVSTNLWHSGFCFILDLVYKSLYLSVSSGFRVENCLVNSLFWCVQEKPLILLCSADEFQALYMQELKLEVPWWNQTSHPSRKTTVTLQTLGNWGKHF